MSELHIKPRPVLTRPQSNMLVPNTFLYSGSDLLCKLQSTIAPHRNLFGKGGRTQKENVQFVGTSQSTILRLQLRFMETENIERNKLTL